MQAGVRRIFAKTRSAAVEEGITERAALVGAARSLGVAPQDLGSRIAALQNQIRELKKRGAGAAKQDVKSQRKALIDGAKKVGEALVIVDRVEVPRPQVPRRSGRRRPRR